MTITYSSQVVKTGFAKFVIHLFRWNGSILKLVWKELILLVIIYYILALIYNFALDDHRRKTFEVVCAYFAQYEPAIPVALALGFYANFVLSRWWVQLELIPWPDRLAIFISANVVGTSDKARMIRRTIARYAVTALVIALSTISPVVKRRFPRFKHLADAGLLLPNELKELKDVPTPHHKFFVPMIWACNLLHSAKEEGFVKSDGALKSICDEVNSFRNKLCELFTYDRISVPLIYTQVNTIIVYTFFLAELMGDQFISNEMNLVFPLVTFLQFYFYLGWLKIAECLINPLEDDDDDFEINKMIDRNLQMSYLIVDSMYMKHPVIQKDMYWDMEEFEMPMCVPLKTGCAALSCCNDHPTDMFREDHGLWKDMYLSPEVLQKLRKVRHGMSIQCYASAYSSSSVDPGTRLHISISDVQIEERNKRFFNKSSQMAQTRSSEGFQEHRVSFLSAQTPHEMDVLPTVSKKRNNVDYNENNKTKVCGIALQHGHTAPLASMESPQVLDSEF